MRPDQSQCDLPVDLAGRMTFGDLEAFRINLAHQKAYLRGKVESLGTKPNCSLEAPWQGVDFGKKLEDP
jgi:hypothetical protein